MSARDDILSAIRAAAVPASPAAASVRHEPAADVEVLRTQFLRILSEVGGKGVVRDQTQSVAQVTESLLGEHHATAMVVRGRFAVAENGAVYVDAADLALRTDIVRGEHLVVLVPADAIVATMHEAVRLMPTDSACGWFLSGPSKTADIEQSLVFGAQGSRTHHVIFEP